jgi:ABC-2 type transport system ATP-binding protein
MLVGLTRPDSGRAEVLGYDVTRQAAALKERIGVQLQTVALYPNLTVGEVVDLFRSFYRTSQPADQLIASLDLTEKRNAQTRHLSGGQRQRLSVALALVNDPELLFLDEPTTGLDPAARRALWDLISDLRRRGKTIVMTTHYLEEAETLCDRVAIMDHGRILELGTVEELVSRRFKERSVRFEAVDGIDDPMLAKLPAVSRVVHENGAVSLFTGDVPATIAGLLALTESRGSEPENLMVRRATLEDVFLDLTGRALRD